jgi:malonate-semialdehyde dehydrogenase (acetylating)/methylmalonate-semialdehyde dehydrogenase
MPDARIADAVRNMITSCFGCAGQRCMAASVIVCVGDETYDAVRAEFVAAARKVAVADPLDPTVADDPTAMGPVISAKARQFIHDMIETGEREGSKLLLDGRSVSVPGGKNGHFVGPTVFADVPPDSRLHRTEVFGPVVALMRADSLDDAIGLINDGEHGNGASIYTQNGYWARKFKLEAECGMIGVNVGIPAPVAYLPFGGMKASQWADVKAQGKAVVNFFTEDKIVTERYWVEE